MGSLSNLYISQSYQSLLHFATDTSASTTLINIEDGVGQDLGISLNTLGDLTTTGQITSTGLLVSGAVDVYTRFSGSTQGYVNQSSVNTEIRITGSYSASFNDAEITEIGIGWIVNGGALSNGRVIGITGTPNSDVTYTVDQPYTANNVTYTFTGSIERPVQIIGDLGVSDDLFVGGHLIIEDGVEITGSIDITGDVTASNAWVQGDLVVSGTINAYEIITTIESASVIFSSGSNILGDTTLDTQTLIGDVIMSGSSSLTGSMGITGNISSSTVSGIGNVTIYSASVNQRLSSLQVASASFENFTSSTYINFSTSVDSRLDFLEGPFSSSVSQQITTLQLFTASVGLVTTQSFQDYTASTNQRLNSLQVASASIQTFTSSANIRLNNLETTTASLNISVNALNISTASLNSFSASTNVRLNNLETTSASVNTSIANINVATASLQSKTGSYATTGSNTFIGNEIFSGSVRGNVVPITITASTASMDCSLGNFFTLTLASSTTTRLVATNIQPGETITLRVTQPSTTGSLSYPSNIKFANALAYSASSVANAVDVVTFVSFDSTNLLAASTKNLV